MKLRLGLQRARTGVDPGDRSAVPDDLAVTGEAEIGIGSGGQRLGAGDELAVDRLERGRPSTALADRGIALGNESKNRRAADNSPSTKTPPSSSMLDITSSFCRQAAHQHAGAAVDKTLSEPFMQGIRETILDAAGPQLPIEGVGKPVAVGDESPGADMGDAGRQGVDVALGAVAIGELAGEPVVGDAAVAAGQKAEDAGHQVGMLGTRYVAVVGDLAHFPQELHRLGRRGKRDDVVVAGDELERLDIEARLGSGQKPGRRQRGERPAQCRQARQRTGRDCAIAGRGPARSGDLRGRSTSSAGNGSASAVTPKVPSFI